MYEDFDIVSEIQEITTETKNRLSFVKFLMKANDKTFCKQKILEMVNSRKYIILRSNSVASVDLDPEPPFCINTSKTSQSEVNS